MKRYKENGHPDYQADFTKQTKLPYQMQLTARLLLDNLCYEWNHNYFVEKINYALVNSDEKMVDEYSLKYKSLITKYIKEANQRSISLFCLNLEAVKWIYLNLVPHYLDNILR